MLNFRCDYLEGALPQILDKLVSTNLSCQRGYCGDEYCKSAAEKFKELCHCPDGEVFFISGGTQTNQQVISAMLRPYEAVISPSTGHITEHEAGSIEHSGHKVIELPASDGKISASQIREYLEGYHSNNIKEHLVYPGMVYISYPTELGTLYTRDELAAVYDVCREYDIPLYIDGARLAYGLACDECDMTLDQFAHLCDAFYFGGTKAGTLCGEALMFTHGNAPAHFETSIKQCGALLAKGRVFGVQFDVLFSDELYLRAGRHAIEAAQKIRKVLKDMGTPMLCDSPTNQLFPIFENSYYEKLSKDVVIGDWCRIDKDHTAVRIVTSWATREEDVDALCQLLK